MLKTDALDEESLHNLTRLSVSDTNNLTRLLFIYDGDGPTDMHGMFMFQSLCHLTTTRSMQTEPVVSSSSNAGAIYQVGEDSDLNTSCNTCDFTAVACKTN